MTGKGLTEQSDIERLTAWMDGELLEAEARQVAELVAADPRWRTTCEHFRAVDRALDAAAPPPTLTRDLTEAIICRARRRRTLRRAAWTAGALAAAACVLLAVTVAVSRRPAPTGAPGPALTAQAGGVQQKIDAALEDVPADERFIVQNLSMFRDYDQVNRFRPIVDIADGDTLEALAALEEAEGL